MARKIIRFPCLIRHHFWLTVLILPGKCPFTFWFIEKTNWCLFLSVCPFVDGKIASWYGQSVLDTQINEKKYELCSQLIDFIYFAHAI